MGIAQKGHESIIIWTNDGATPTHEVDEIKQENNWFLQNEAMW